MKYDLVITGATGFIGASFTRYFAQQGFRVLATGRSMQAPGALLKYADYLPLDLTGRIPGISARICIHCAGLASERASFEELMKVNVDGTRNLFEAVEAEHFIHISSASVYPASSNVHFEDEEIDEASLSLYGLSKRKAETWLEEQQERRGKITVLRPRAVYGIGDRVLLPRILRLRKGPFIIQPGALDFKISLTNIANLQRATEKVVEGERNYSFRIFNVADSQTYFLKEVLGELLQYAYQRKFPTLKISPGLAVVLGKITRNPDINEKVLNHFLCDHQISNKRLCSELKLELPYSLSSYLPQLQEWVTREGIDSVMNGNDLLPWMC